MTRTVMTASAAALAMGMLLPAAASAQDAEVQGGDIIVTATKREESLRDVALAISAVTGDQLAQQGAQGLSDYIARMPGVVFNDYQPSLSEVIIRGVASTTYHEQGQTTTGYYLNEIPLSEPGWPTLIPDVDTFDLDRVEVLRGPQGTLFGSSSLGGLVNYVVHTADPTKFDAAAQALIGATDNGSGDMNHAVKGMINIPLVQDKLAVRLVGLDRYDSGYIDNTRTGEEGINDLRTRGLRGSVVFTPAEGTRISYLSMFQETRLEDQTTLRLGGYTTDSYQAQPQKTRLLVNSLRVDQDLGDAATVTVIGALSDKKNRTVFDETPTGWLQGLPVLSTYKGYNHARIRSIEARVASQGERRFNWLVGVFYQYSEKYLKDDVYQAGAAAFIDANPADFGGNPGSLLAPGDVFNQYITAQSNKDLGIFGEVSFKPVPEIELTVGGRYYDVSADAEVTIPPYANFPGEFTATGISFGSKQSENGFTPKVTVAYRPNKDFMAYATYSQGYRVGGANPNAGRIGGIGVGTLPVSYDSDSVDNYEIGARATLAGGRLLLDATLFRIDWKDIQVRLFSPAPYFYSYVTNAGGARIDGVEFSGSWQVAPIFRVATSVTYQDSKVTEPFAGFAEGLTLPGSSKWSVNSTATLELKDVPGKPRFELAHRYLSSAPVAFGSPATRGDFNLFDLRGSVEVDEHVSLSAFVSNLFNEYGVLNAPFSDFDPRPQGSVVRPRTIGLRFDWRL